VRDDLVSQGALAMTLLPNGVLIRAARSTDAEHIAELYRSAYDPGDGGRAEDHYPFPTLMKPGRLARLLCEGGWLWSVAELSQRIVAVIGARIGHLRCGGNAAFADLIGLAVGAEWRGQGIGQQVARHLDREIFRTVDWALAETRTATLGGWKIMARLEYPVIGLEPLCHRTPSGYEPMLLQAKVSAQRMTARRPGTVCSHLASLAKAVSAQFLTGKLIQGDRDTDTSGSAQCFTDIQSRKTGNAPLAVPIRQLPVVLNDRIAGPNRLIEINIDRPGFVLGGHADIIDRRLYINSLNARDGAASGNAVSVALKEALDIAASRSFSSCVIDVRADNGELVDVLTKQGFEPTAYYPGLLCEQGYALDAAQFTNMLTKPTVPNAPIALNSNISQLFGGV
jgi:ribosomal protein S18 acetylase RimI-like enzyme